MLTRAEAIAECKGGRVVPDRLPAARREVYLAYAEEMLRLYREGVGTGKTRGELHREIGGVLRGEPDRSPTRVAAFAKLLDDESRYDKAGGGRAAGLRREVYELACRQHPLVERPAGNDLFAGLPAASVREQVARAVGKTGWAEVDAVLFADVIEFHRLASFAGYPDAAALLDRYDVAQAQAALYGAAGMRAWVERDFRRVLRGAKLAGLLHEIRRVGDDGNGGYEFTFSGPASVLRRTRRYGVGMARLLAVLLACRGRWRLQAEVGRGRNLVLELDENSGLRGHLPAGTDYDSGVEARFAAAWGAGEREGWRLEREGEILQAGQRTFVPDFVLRHAATGRRVLLEIVGFWTPEYLEDKWRTLALFADERILLAVRAGAARTFARPDGEAIVYKTALQPADVLARLGQWAS